MYRCQSQIHFVVVPPVDTSVIVSRVNIFLDYRTILFLEKIEGEIELSILNSLRDLFFHLRMESSIYLYNSKCNNGTSWNESTISID
jgi:hypothetical protein